MSEKVDKLMEFR